ncbi:hypothetical protein NBRC116188_23470 [Oceaniserpentilla sp. 4NH20-0058]
MLASCATSPTSDPPDWVSSPEHHQVVANCESHALGKYKQQECAVTRARLELAARKGIEIKSVSVMTESANSLRSNSTLNGKTVQEVNSKIKTRLVETYHDVQRDILWVLVEEN